MSSHEDSSKASSRDAIKEVPDLTTPPETKRKLWALLIGISEYKHRPWSLKYAHADAEALHKYFIGQRERGFHDQEIMILTDEAATERAIRKGLRSFLQRPAKDDFVVVFFSCHGGPDPNRPDNLYLYPHDTDPEDIASTAILMSHVQESLSKKNLLSDRVILLVDACHAAGTATGNDREGPGPRSGSVDAADAMNRFVAGMAKSRPGMATLTAAERGESAWEGKEWGGGHGVFTHFLLEGLGGAAARPEDDGMVTVGNLFDYVIEKVTEATSTARPQHPSAILDAKTRQWPIAVFSDLVANECYQLGRALYAVAQRINDPRRFDQAIHEHSKAIKQAAHLGRALPAARYEIGRCRLAAGDCRGALTELRRAVDEELDEFAAGRAGSASFLADARFWHWAAAYLAGDRPAAAQASSVFLEAHRGDRRAPLVEIGLSAGATRRRALLIGVNEYRTGGNLRGAKNDVESVRAMLQEAGFLSGDISVLIGNAATRDGILGALKEFGTPRSETEELVVYFAGRTLLDKPDEASSKVLILGSDYDGDAKPGITGKELHEVLVALPATHLLVILDTCHGGGIVERARADRKYTLLSATDRGELASECKIDGVYRGEFTSALVAACRESPGLLAPAQAIAWKASHHARNQAVLVGDQAGPLLRSLASSLAPAPLKLSLRPWIGDCSPEAIERRVDSFPRGLLEALPEIVAEYGRMALGQRAYELAERLFEMAMSMDGSAVAHLGHVAARVHLQDYDAAGRFFTALDATPEQARLAPARDALDKLRGGRPRRALLVGVSKDLHGDPVTQGVLEDVRAMRCVLEELFRDRIEIEELIDETATYDALVERFHALLERAREAPCLFYYAGQGDMSNGPRLKVFDTAEQQVQHITTDEPVRRDAILLSRLAEIVELAGDSAKNLVCIVDAGWAPSVRLPWSSHGASRCADDEMPRSVGVADWLDPVPAAPRYTRTEIGFSQFRDIGYSDGEVMSREDAEFKVRRAARARAVAHLGLGGVTIYNASLLARMSPKGAEPGEEVVEAAMPSFDDPHARVTHGVMTHALISALREAPGSEGGCHYARLHRWMASSLQRLQPVFIGSFLHEQFMGNVVIEDEFEREMRRLGLDEPIVRAVALLDQRIQRLASMPDGRARQQQEKSAYLEKGIAHLALGELERAIGAFMCALRADGLNDPEVLAYLGRALAEHGADLDAAVAHLQNALDQWRDGEAPAYIHYYYCKALQDRMENRQREDSERLERMWRKYLEMGAPFGQRKRRNAPGTR